MNYYRVINAYLDKQSRLPTLPPNLLETIHAWLSPLYVKNINNYFAKKPTQTVSKTFSVQDDRLQVKNIKVKFVPKQFNFHAVYNPNYNLILVGIPNYLKKKTLESPEELSYDLKTYLKHELIHFLQFNTEHSIGGKFPTEYYKPGQEYVTDYSTDYYISPEEIKPNLSNQADRFKYVYGDSFTSENIKQFIANSDFFNALKETDSKLFQNTVKDFYLLVASD
jgi:hypothetical protein